MRVPNWLTSSNSPIQDVVPSNPSEDNLCSTKNSGYLFTKAWTKYLSKQIVGTWYGCGSLIGKLPLYSPFKEGVPSNLSEDNLCSPQKEWICFYELEYYYIYYIFIIPFQRLVYTKYFWYVIQMRVLNPSIQSNPSLRIMFIQPKKTGYVHEIQKFRQNIFPC